MQERKKIRFPTADNGTSTTDGPQDARPKRAKKVTPERYVSNKDIVSQLAEEKAVSRHEPKANSTRDARPKKTPFEQSFTRITTYIRAESLQRIRDLQANGQVDSLTRLLDAALTDHLKAHFPQ